MTFPSKARAKFRIPGRHCSSHCQLLEHCASCILAKHGFSGFDSRAPTNHALNASAEVQFRAAKLDFLFIRPKAEQSCRVFVIHLTNAHGLATDSARCVAT